MLDFYVEHAGNGNAFELFNRRWRPMSGMVGGLGGAGQDGRELVGDGWSKCGGQ